MMRGTTPTVKFGFCGRLAGAVAFGAVDLPLALLIGVCVAIARRRLD
jgi:hypothetical protein